MRFLASLLLATIGSSLVLLPPPTAASLPRGNPQGDAIAYLQERKIIRNNPSSDLRLRDSLTRVEALAVVIRSREKFAPQLLWFGKHLPAISLFPDIDQHAWYAPLIEVSFLEGIMTGYPDGTFRPGEPMTTEQALVTLQHAYSWKGTTAFRSSDQLPNKEREWYSAAVSEAIDRNLISAETQLMLGTPIARGQFFEILYRMHVADQRREYVYGEEDEEYKEYEEYKETLQFLPLRITPLPFRENDPFVIRLPSTAKKPEHTKSSSVVYASRKPFAITIPTLGIIDFTVAHPADPFSDEGILEPLQDGLGHLFSYPGTPGKSMIYGHSSSWPWDRSEYAKAFRQVNKLQAGDRVYVTYSGKLHVYDVTRKQIIAASDTSPYSDDGREELILYTCWPPDTANDSRYLVHALPVETIALR